MRQATDELVHLVASFKTKRTEFLQEMDKLRSGPETFSQDRYQSLANELGILEVQAAIIEAQTYHRIRSSMTEKQNQAMMSLRADYILDSKEMESLTDYQRGEAIYNLCQSCHANPQIAPSLQNIVNSPIASAKGFDYSVSLKDVGEQIGNWDEKSLDAFLAGPSQFVPGTKMGFQGLLNQTDRDALIDYLRSL